MAGCCLAAIAGCGGWFVKKVGRVRGFVVVNREVRYVSPVVEGTLTREGPRPVLGETGRRLRTNTRCVSFGVNPTRESKRRLVA